jgi:hypothetical protein
MEPITITLKHPVELTPETTVSEIIISRRPCAGDVEDFGNNPTVRDMNSLISKLTNQTPTLIKKIDLEDYAEIVAKVTSFLPPGLLTGASQ